MRRGLPSILVPAACNPRDNLPPGVFFSEADFLHNEMWQTQTNMAGLERPRRDVSVDAIASRRLPPPRCREIRLEICPRGCVIWRDRRGNSGTKRTVSYSIVSRAELPICAISINTVLSTGAL